MIVVRDGKYFIDDDLSDEQLGVISGLYHVNTGRPNQFIDFSWWPKHSTWRECGLDVGYWSSACEAWFQQRLKAIKGGYAQPNTATEWRKALGNGQTQVLVSNTKQVAEVFLNNHSSP
ncbi:hypothetical protein AMATHDRAFT_140710 [Amanita thiersii Skay4041]|uniref:Uncharacterized protein n=1 Tax=Amanita thiersii Skay4041 TaxID=703135 RepID=A0A2A9NV73_9AGAR|nr:hypothetical protein AMATHDRAFT_140710 [Amanita thiersii Skay4041]